MILLVEDNDLQRTATQTLLQDRGWPVRAVSTASAALEQMRQKRPAVLVLDLVMAPVPGLSLLQTVVEDSELAKVNVIVTTALPTRGDQPALKLVLGRLQGKSVILQKPFDIEDLVACLEGMAPAEKKDA